MKFLSSIFGRCFNVGHCNGITIFGVCLKCGGAMACMCCGKVHQKSGRFWRIPYSRKTSSSALCDSCGMKHYPEAWETVMLHRQLGQDCRSKAEQYDKTDKIDLRKIAALRT